MFATAAVVPSITKLQRHLSFVNEFLVAEKGLRCRYWTDSSCIRPSIRIRIHTKASKRFRTMGSTSPPPPLPHEWSAPRVRQTFLEYFQKNGHKFGKHF